MTTKTRRHCGLCKNQAEWAIRSKTVSSILPWSLLQFLPWVSINQTNSFFPRLCLVSVLLIRSKQWKLTPGSGLLLWCWGWRAGKTIEFSEFSKPLWELGRWSWVHCGWWPGLWRFKGKQRQSTVLSWESVALVNWSWRNQLWLTETRTTKVKSILYWDNQCWSARAKKLVIKTR